MKKIIIGICMLFLLVGCNDNAQYIPPLEVSTSIPNIDVAICEPFGLFPKGDSVNTMEKEGVEVMKCEINNITCYYIAPLGKLGASIDCE